MPGLFSLTRPISASSPAGTLLPWERPYSTEPIATLTHNGANLFHIDMSPSASTRILSARIGDPQQTSLRDMDPARVLNREAVVVRVDGIPNHEISAAELSEALEATSFTRGDALLISTGWGTAATGGEKVENAPFLSPAAVALLLRTLDENGIDLVLTDLPYLTAPGGRHVSSEWLTVQPWFRPSWPSQNAATYLNYHYSREKALEDWKPTLDVLQRALLVLGLANVDAIRTQHLIINIAPFQVRDVGEAPCTVVAQAMVR